jgi:hypothetical protein
VCAPESNGLWVARSSAIVSRFQRRIVSIRHFLTGCDLRANMQPGAPQRSLGTYLEMTLVVSRKTGQATVSNEERLYCIEGNEVWIQVPCSSCAGLV